MEQQGDHSFNKIRLGLATAAFLFVLLAYPAISHAGGLGFAPLAVIAGLAGYVGYGRRFSFKDVPGVVYALVIFLIWVGVTSLWSPYDDTKTLTNPMKLILGVALYLGVFLLPPVRWLKHVLIGIGVIGLALLLLEHFTSYSISRTFYPLGEGEHPTARINSIYQNLSHAITTLALVAGPVIYYLCRAHKFGAILAAVWTLGAMFIAYKFQLTAGLLALIAAIGFMGLAYVIKAKAVDLLLFCAAIMVLFAPLFGYSMQYISEDRKAAMLDSWEHRIEMWGYTAEMVAQQPIIGHGFDAVRTFDRTYLGMSINGKPWEQTIIALHPHNAGLHIWAEAGAIGAALACITLFMLRQSLKNAMDRSSELVIPMVGFLAAALTLCTITYGIWQEWFWGALLLIGALIPMSIMNAD